MKYKWNYKIQGENRSNNPQVQAAEEGENQHTDDKVSKCLKGTLHDLSVNFAVILWGGFV